MQCRRLVVLKARNLINPAFSFAVSKIQGMELLKNMYFCIT